MISLHRFSGNLLKKIFIIFFLYITLNLFSTELISMRGNAVQGGILICETDSSVEKLFLDYKEIPISDDKAVIGFDRDEKLKHKLTIVLTSGQMYTSNFQIAKRVYKVQKIDGIKKKYVEQPKDKKLIERIERESGFLKQARKKIKQNTNLYFDDFCIPVTEGKVTGIFGSQRILNGIPKRPHNGFDIAAPKGTEIKAMTTSVVALTGNYYYNGKFVLLDHGGGLSSIYIHMSSVDVEKGDYILIGEKIGEIGSTGLSTGNHLHWGVGFKGKRIDPELLLSNMENVFFILRQK